MTSLEQIAASLQGYDPQALSLSDANAFLQQLVQTVPDTEDVPLMQALHRVLAHDVISPVDVPAHDNSAMDGYAFDGHALGAQALRLQVVGTAYAGKAWVGAVAPGQCVKIMTGAVMPQGLDTVVPQELVEVQGDTVHLPAGLLKRGDNRRFKGEDLQMGKPALRMGTRVGPAALGLLASLGMPTVQAFRKLRVAYFSTGDEVLSLGDAPREGAVYDSNRYTVIGMLQKLGIEVLDLGVVRDQPQALEDAFRAASSQADAIITSGGVSVGEADHTKATMKKVAGNDAAVAFWKIAMRPGRPMAVGRLGSCVLFGLPGNPVAVMVTFLALVRPALLAMMGSTPAQLPLLRACALEAIRKRPGRTEYQRAVVSRNANGQLDVRLTGQQGSGVLSSMVEANGLVVLPHAQGNIAIGDAVEVMMFEGAL
jgi:molybdopterin molybdotransferase